MESSIETIVNASRSYPFEIYGSTGVYNQILNNTSQTIDRFDADDVTLLTTGGSMAPPRDPLYVVVPVTIIYASIFITGTIGNISTCIVIARNKNMHTATNYYLFSLAVSDLLLLISGLPAEIYLVWCKYPYIFGEGFCIIRGLAAETSTNASVLTITAFTVERYVAICHPFLSQTMSKLSRAIKLILMIWLVAFSFALPQALQFGVLRHEFNPSMVMCTVKKVIIEHSFEMSTFLFFVMPMSLITVLYALIGLKLRKSNMMKNRNHGRVNADPKNSNYCRHHPGRSSRRVLKMLVAVVVAFFVCWAPFHIQRLVAIYGTNDEDHMTSKSKLMEFLYLLMTYVSGVLYYFSATINPILYNIMSNKFRMAFLETLSKTCGISGLGVKREQRSYSSLSRSQQRTINGVYGSKTIGTGGTGFQPDSTDCSYNSVKEESPRYMTTLMEQNSFEEASDPTSYIMSNHVVEKCGLGIGNGIDDSAKNNFELHESGQSIPKNGRLANSKWSTKHKDKIQNHDGPVKDAATNSWSGKKKYATVEVSDVIDSSTENQWRKFLRWLPGINHSKSIERRTRSHTITNDCVLNDVGSEQRQEAYSMTISDSRAVISQRPV